MSDRLLSEFSQRQYHTYPHANGFADGGASIVLGQRDGEAARLCKVDLTTGQSRCVGEFSTTQRDIWFDIAADTNCLATVVQDRVYLVNLDNDEQRLVYRHPDHRPLYPIPSIRRDGEVVIVGYNHDDRNGFLAINTRSGEARVLVEHPWLTGHCHQMPSNPAWVSFCHEGQTATVPDRMWAWHAELAPRGRPIWDQASRAPGLWFYVGHEVASWHDESVIAVAYGDSREGPRGLYEIFLDGRPPRLISEGDRDLHCNISRDGKWAVVDTSGRHDRPGRGWQDVRGESDILLIDCATGVRRLLAHTSITTHPWHPHPTFTPDGKAVVYAEGSGDSGRVHLVRI